MEHNNGEKKGTSMVCTCCGHYGEGSGCQCGWHSGHRVFRAVLVCIIILLAFWFGVKMGEFKDEFLAGRYDGYGYGRMMYYNPGGPMMQGGYGGYEGYGAAPILPNPAAPPALPPVPANTK